MDAAQEIVEVVVRGAWSLPQCLKEHGFPIGEGLELGPFENLQTEIGVLGLFRTVASLVEFFCLVSHGFHWFAISIELVDEGSVQVLFFGAFSWPFF